MLIRRQHGCIFHIVSAETATYFLCLCGARVFKNDVSRQMRAQGQYQRCLACRKLDNARLARCRGLKVYKN